jgi:hypothetical protein
MTKAKWIFKGHAEKAYGGAKVLYHEVYDFVLPDGRNVVVKAVAGDFVRFGGAQLRTLGDGDLVAFVDPSAGEVLAVLPFSEVRGRRVLDLGGRRVFVVAEDRGRRVLRIPCSEEVYREFRRLAEELGGEEEAMKKLLESYRYAYKYRLPGMGF